MQGMKRFSKSLPLLTSKPVTQNFVFIEISYYRNNVGENICCDKGLSDKNTDLGGDSQNFLHRFLIFFVTLGLKILRL